MADETLLGELLNQQPPAKRSWQASPVRSRDLHDQPKLQRAVKTSRVIKQSRIRGSDRILEWTAVFILWLGSTAGNVAAFNGGFDATFNQSWQPQTWTVGWHALIGGCVWQIVWQWVQFANCHNPRGWKYRLALVNTFVPNCYTFGIPLVIFFGRPLLATGLPFWPTIVATGVASAMILLGVDILQEKMLIDNEG